MNQAGQTHGVSLEQLERWTWPWLMTGTGAHVKANWYPSLVWPVYWEEELCPGA